MSAPLSGAKDLKPGESGSVTVEYERVPFHSAPLAALGYRCADHQVNVRVIYAADALKDSTDMAPPRQVHAWSSVRPRAGIAAVIFGGIAGVLLASLLGGLHEAVTIVRRRRTKREPAEDLPASKWARVRSEAVTFLYGVAVTTTAIYLLQATTVPGFPVAVSHCDPLGGIILGFFFRPIGETLYGRMARGQHPGSGAAEAQ
jgi:hypothetical protein